MKGFREIEVFFRNCSFHASWWDGCKISQTRIQRQQQRTCSCRPEWLYKHSACRLHTGPKLISKKMLSGLKKMRDDYALGDPERVMSAYKGR